MNKLLRFTLILSISFLVACNNDDETPPPHEVGVWNLKGILATDLPGDYSLWEGFEFSLGFFGWDTYVVELKADGTYEIEVTQGLSEETDEGTWELEDGELILTSNDSGDLEWVIEKNEDDDLRVKEEVSFISYPSNADYTELIESEFWASATNDQKDSAFVALPSAAVTHNLEWVFERDE